MPEGKPNDLFDRISGRLWVGGILNPAIIREASSRGVTAVLNVAQELDDSAFLRGSNLKAFKAGTWDDKKEKPWSWFSRAIPWALGLLAQPNQQILVHCHAGLHRSTSMAYAIMRAQGFTGRDAASIIQRGRRGSYLDYQNDAERELRRHGYILAA